MSSVTTSGVTGQRGNPGNGATVGYPPNTCERRPAPPADGEEQSKEFIIAHRSAVGLNTSKISGKTFEDFGGISGITKSGIAVLTKPSTELACCVAVVDGESSFGSGFLLLTSRVVAAPIKSGGDFLDSGGTGFVSSPSRHFS